MALSGIPVYVWEIIHVDTCTCTCKIHVIRGLEKYNQVHVYMYMVESIIRATYWISNWTQNWKFVNIQADLKISLWWIFKIISCNT